MAYLDNESKDSATLTIAAYREDHKITPVARFDGTGHYCAHDSLPLDPRKGGWVHSQSALHRAQDIAGYVPVTKCRHRYIPGGVACNMTLARHLREKELRQINPLLPPLHDFVDVSL